MPWIGKSKQPPQHHRLRRHHAEPHVDRETEDRLAHFLITHDRLEPREGRPLLHIIGCCKNFDGTTDYSVRTRVREMGGAIKRFTSHIREYPSGRLRLIR